MPFLILMILVVPLTRLIVGKSYGSVASIGAAGGGGIPLCGASGGKQPA